MGKEVRILLKYCKDKWYKNKDLLEKALRETDGLNNCDYAKLVEMVVEYILNPNSEYGDIYDKEHITVIDDGDYQGTLLFMIPAQTYQPAEYNYLLTFVNYGSCSGCDTLLSIQAGTGKPTERQIEDFMGLCKDLVCNIIKPYNGGWRRDEKYIELSDEPHTDWSSYED